MGKTPMAGVGSHWRLSHNSNDLLRRQLLAVGAALLRRRGVGDGAADAHRVSHFRSGSDIGGRQGMARDARRENDRHTAFTTEDFVREARRQRASAVQSKTATQGWG